jgi:UDP-3-O-[3-hydroxymyristoyl] glucosamine N-acyltransferase
MVKNSKTRFKITQLARRVGGQVVGTCSPDSYLKGTCSINNYHRGSITFVKNPGYGELLSSLTEAVILVPKNLESLTRTYPQNTYIVVEDVYRALLDIQELFYGNERLTSSIDISLTTGIHSTAQIAEDALIGEHVHIGKNTIIMSGAVIMQGSTLMDNVRVGENTVIYPGVCVCSNTVIGRDCIIHAGAQIGVSGFRFVQFPELKEVRKMLHVGGVSIGDRVEIGGNSTVARATFEGDSTILEDDVKLDSQVHIGHNSRIGKRTLIAAQTCISGSVEIGEDVWIGAGVTVSNTVKIGNQVKVLLNAVVAYNVNDNQIVSGFYAMPHREWKLVYQGHRNQWPSLIG